MDIMEFNMHFLGLKTEQGKKDKTLSVALDFLKELLPSQEEANTKGVAGQEEGKKSVDGKDHIIVKG